MALVRGVRVLSLLEAVQAPIGYEAPGAVVGNTVLDEAAACAGALIVPLALIAALVTEQL